MPKQATDTFTEDVRKDQQAIETRDDLRKQSKYNVFLQWTEDDQANFDAGKALPYPKVEGVNINGVQFWIERGGMREVPLSVAIILANAGKIPWDMVPDKVGEEPVREKAQAIAERKALEEERRRRYAGIGDGLLR